MPNTFNLVKKWSCSYSTHSYSHIIHRLLTDLYVLNCCSLKNTRSFKNEKTTVALTGSRSRITSGALGDKKYAGQ